MSISSREEANKYYQLVNGLIDDYIENHKIRPSRLSTYLKPNTKRFEKFLLKNGLQEVNGIERVVMDVIEDRNYMESDGIITFESFKYFESTDFKIANLKECLYKGIEKADIKIEKILADYFDVNLGSIDVIDSKKHLFKIDDWNGDDWKVVVYSSEDLEIIKNNLEEFLYEEISSKEIEVIEDIKINLKNLIKEEEFKEIVRKEVFDEKLDKLICEILGEDWIFEKDTKGFKIWIS